MRLGKCWAQGKSKMDQKLTWSACTVLTGQHRGTSLGPEWLPERKKKAGQTEAIQKL